MESNSDFEEAWKRYVNSSGAEQSTRLVNAALRAATTIDEMVRVFNAFHSDPDLVESGIRSNALKKMIAAVQTKEDAERVYALASKRGDGPGGYLFHVRQKEAKVKLDSFATTT